MRRYNADHGNKYHGKKTTSSHSPLHVINNPRPFQHTLDKTSNDYNVPTEMICLKADDVAR
jgi:hypothetical protein